MFDPSVTIEKVLLLYSMFVAQNGERTVTEMFKNVVGYDNLKIKDFNINRYDANALKFSVVKLVPSADKSTLFRNFGSLMFTRIYHVDTICKTYLYNVARSTESEINIFDYISFEDKI